SRVRRSQLDVVRQWPARSLAAAAQHDGTVPAPTQLGGDGFPHEPGAAGDAHRQGLRGRAGRLEDAADGPGAVRPDALQRRADEPIVEGVAERAEWQLVGHCVIDPGPTLNRGERMRVLPAPIRTAELDIAEAVRRLVLGDERAPSRGQAEEGAKPIVDVQPVAHPDVVAGEPEVELRRRDAAEVHRLREELEDLLERSSDDRAGLDGTDSGHRLVPCADEDTAPIRGCTEAAPESLSSRGTSPSLRPWAPGRRRTRRRARTRSSRGG